MLATIIVIAVVVLDQVSKAIVVANLGLHEGAGFIPYVLSFYHTRNTGAAWSILQDHRWVFMLLSVLAIAGIIVILIKEYRRHKLLTISLAMILGGGFGNMIDRIFSGYVVDFLKFEFIDFPIFNIADSFITVGAVLLGVYLIFFETKVEKRLKAQKAATVNTENTDKTAGENAENVNNDGE